MAPKVVFPPDTLPEFLQVSTISMKNIVLTDAAQGIWLDSFSLGEEPGLQLAGASDWSISKRTLRGGPSDGVDVVELNNGALSVSLLPTRGMGLWKGAYRGIPLGWESPVAWPVHPGLVDLSDRGGLGWLSGFNEWLCRCGLSSNGAPGTDLISDDDGRESKTELTLHGKIANLPAHQVVVHVSDEGPGSLSVTGIVDEASLFGPRLRLISTLTTAAGSNRLTIVDEIVNLGGQSAELELLYHINLGRPFLEPGSTFAAPIRQIAPRDARAAQDIETYSLYKAPTAGYTEQVYFMELAATADDRTLALLRNAAGDRGLSVHFQRRQLPYFSLWKNTQAEQDGYVTGLEPATNFPNLKTFERRQGRVVQLPPGASYKTELEMAVHATAGDVAEIETQIAAIQGDTPPQVQRQPHPTYSDA
jgi:hypothetical protein